MAAAVTTEPDGKSAGRVTMAATVASLIPPLAAAAVVIVCFLVGILGAEAAAAAILAILATAGFTTGAVFTTAKKTPTDQVVVKREILTATEGSVEEKDAAAVAASPQAAGVPGAAVPDGTGEHRAAAGSTVAETVEPAPDPAPVVTETTIEVP